MRSLLVGLSVPSLSAWAFRRAPVAVLADPVLGALAALTLGALAALVTGRRLNCDSTSERTLCWDGQDWLLVGAGDAGRIERRGDVALMLDLGPWMLVRFLPHRGMGAPAWLPFTATGDAARWAALRGALWNWRSHEAGR